MDARNAEGMVEVGADVDGAAGGAGATLVDEGTLSDDVVDGAPVSVALGVHPGRARTHTIPSIANGVER